MGNLISTIRNIIGSLTGAKKATGSKAPLLATAGFVGVTAGLSYLVNRRMKKVGGYIPS